MARDVPISSARVQLIDIPISGRREQFSSQKELHFRSSGLRFHLVHTLGNGNFNIRSLVHSRATLSKKCLTWFYSDLECGFAGLP
jgi:hypothetical protein